MGFTPRDVDDMTLWELSAAVDGWNRANGAQDSLEPPTEEEFEDMLLRHADFLGMH